MKIFTEIEIAADPADLWAVLADGDAYPQWNPYLVSLTGELRVGATITVVMRDTTGKERTFTPEVLVAEPGKELRWLGKVSPGRVFDAEHIFRIEPLAPGRSRFVHEEHFRGIAVPFMSRWLRSTIQPQFEAMNTALATRASAH